MSVKVEGLEPVLELLRELLDAAGRERLGVVYSAGADQGHGRYEHYVQDARSQAEIHQGRWQTTQSVAEKREPEAGRAYEQALQALLNGRGVGVVDDAVDDILITLLEDMQEYPAPPAGSRYVRTGTLRASWARERLA